MSLRALHSAGTGMNAYSFNLDVIANNLANASTTAFKKSRTNFEDLYYEHIKPPGAPDQQGLPAPIGIEVGLGTRVAGTEGDFTQGSLRQTTQQLDLAITGDGFFRVQDPTGIDLYTRAGTFTVNANGDVVLGTADVSRLLADGLNIPQDALDLTISGDGVVAVRTAGNNQLQQVGNIELTRFINPQGLLRVGENLFQETDASGQAQQGIPGQDGLGTLKQGFLEDSNVEPVRELVDLIKSQRNFELNTQVVQAADQLLQLVANIRRF
ncbi:flagellar basal-body rod protein FlgG [Stratiformator vulcanicus]|uniref:Flagellar basal-body rod protein FlgG n=1 Tax=Stratiformator vulcanicus TaxID=2527980 RepID=A0A517R3Y5_9PLAN|nr:flagellar basal-body rod protein FlgG [Stratiformator vulcanicus]QDT38576.1 Flagellar basal-body rod protein FlgG [Stratiformator vulcanicus]